MTFLAPWAVWFLAGVPVIVLLYLLKLKRRTLTVSTLMFWQRVLQESRRRALFQRLRNLLSLLLHLLIFLLIVGALAKPALERFVRTGSSAVLILDARARMQAIENGEMRFDRARQLAANYVRHASAEREMALLLASSANEVAAPFTSDEKPLRKAIEISRPTDATGEIESAIRFAEELLAARQGERRIIVFTDRDPAKPVSGLASKIEFISTGSGHDNLAITRFATRPLLNSPQTSEVLLEVRNFGDAAVQGNVELSIDGRLLDVKPYHLPPDGRILEVFPSVPRTTRGGRGWLTARLDKPDALAVDNVAYAALPAPQPHRVLLVSKGNWFLEKLLAADQQVSFELLAPDGFQLAMAEQFDAVILDNHLPPGMELSSLAGNVLFLKQSPFVIPGPPVEQPLIVETDPQHPATRLVNLQNVTIVRAARTQLPEAASGWSFQTPLQSIDQPLMIAGTRRGADREQRIATLAFDVAESDLPLRIAFPILIANTLHWLAGEQSVSSAGLRAGETIPLGPDQALSKTPQTDLRAPQPPPGEEFVRHFFAPLRNGYYQLSEPAGASWIAVNTFSNAESDLRGEAGGTRSAERGTRKPLSVMSLSSAFGWPFWQYLALAAVLLFTVEWWLFHRRRTE